MIEILDKIKKKNNQNQSLYEGEILVTSSKSGLKRKNGQFTTSYACEPITRYHMDQLAKPTPLTLWAAGLHLILQEDSSH